jgi:hypothetical protein
MKRATRMRADARVPSRIAGLVARYSINDMHALAQERGGECLSDEYHSSHGYLRWRCASGHVWETTAKQVLGGAWCARCVKRRYSIDDMRAIARERGGECLSPVYDGSLVKLTWSCDQGHTWSATPNTILGGSWCPQCRLGMGSIEEMQEIARDRGGECLSPRYVNKSTKLRWRCAQGHEWEAIPGHVKRGSWCPSCVGTRRLSISDMRSLARRHRGTCLSHEYDGMNTPLKWRCREGHEFSKTPHLVKFDGSWCPTCSPRQPLTRERLHAAAAARGGRCLAKRALGGEHKYEWECAQGHRWRATASHVLHSGSWCPHCAGTAQATIQQMRAIARTRGGRCLSTEYVKSRERLRWRCVAGHTFEATPAAVAKGRWCLVCKRASRATALTRTSTLTA